MGYEILAIPRCEEGVVLLAGGVISEGNLGVLVRGDLTDTLVLVEGIAIAVSALIGSLGDLSILTIGDVGCLAIVTDELGHALLLGVAVTLAEVIAVELDGIDIAGIAGVGCNLDSDLVVLVLGDDASSEDLPLLEIGIEFKAIIFGITILVVEGYSRSELIILSSKSMTEESEDKLFSSIAGHVDGLSSCILSITTELKNLVSKSLRESLSMRIISNVGTSKIPSSTIVFEIAISDEVVSDFVVAIGEMDVIEVGGVLTTSQGDCKLQLEVRDFRTARNLDRITIKCSPRECAIDIVRDFVTIGLGNGLGFGSRATTRVSPDLIALFLIVGEIELERNLLGLHIPDSLSKGRESVDSSIGILDFLREDDVICSFLNPETALSIDTTIDSFE